MYLVPGGALLVRENVDFANNTLFDELCQLRLWMSLQ